MCPFDYTAVAGEWEGWARKPVNHTSCLAVVTPTKSVHNRCVVEFVRGVVCPIDISVGIGAFVIRLSQISFFFLLIPFERGLGSTILESSIVQYCPVSYLTIQILQFQYCNHTQYWNSSIPVLWINNTGFPVLLIKQISNSDTGKPVLLAHNTGIPVLLIKQISNTDAGKLVHNTGIPVLSVHNTGIPVLLSYTILEFQYCYHTQY